MNNFSYIHSDNQVVNYMFHSEMQIDLMPPFLIILKQKLD